MAKSFFLVEDHSLMRQGIVTYLAKNSEFTCAGVAASPQEFLIAMSEGGASCQPDVLITDLNLEGSMNDGIQLIQTCRRKFPALKIVVYSMYAAADAYISKLSNEEELVIALKRVVAGQTYIDSAISSQMVDYERKLSIFTRRELEILNFILMGNSNSVISETLDVSKRSVENYISRIYDKTGFSSKDELIAHFGRID